ncbi:HalOD1 output domain-containing protein [Haloterrigena salinisoli]|uniref:HalOD1 output domain-containing protein n=1 Tax=Haloterrigena salinisoli TaxID=3132747 RepID=UPI0030D29E61
MPSAGDPTDTSDADEPTYVTTFDPDTGERASEAVITAVAALVGKRPVDLEPLYEAVDPDALDSLIDHARRADTGSHELWFPYAGYEVGVRSDGRIRFYDGAAPSPA